MKRWGLLFLVFCFAVSVAQTKTFDQKVNSSIVNFILFGDINAALEKPWQEKMSFLMGAHFSTSAQDISITGKYGAFGAIRVYLDIPPLKGTPASLIGPYMQMTLGANAAEDDSAAVSVEFWAGYSDMLGDPLFYEFSVGIGRRYTESSAVVGVAAFNLGLYL